MSGATGQTSYLISIDDLTSSHAQALQKETADRNALLPFTNPTSDYLSPYLHKWASAGFPDYYIIFSANITPPTKCSDGVSRDFLGYIAFLLGTDINTEVKKFNSLLNGITAVYGFHDTVFNISVCKSK